VGQSGSLSTNGARMPGRPGRWPPNGGKRRLSHDRSAGLREKSKHKERMAPKHERTKPLTRMTHEIELAAIRENPRPVRGIDETAVAILAESIGLVGQLEPIVLTTDRVLVSGRQRIAAQRARGETTIMATIVDLPDTQARIATLDENLCRLELTAFQRAELLAERKALHEQLHPGSQHGAALKGEGTAPGFTRAMSELTGRGRATVAEDCRIGAMPETVRDLIRGTPLERRKAQLLKLAKLASEDEQLRACRELLTRSATGCQHAGGAASHVAAREGLDVEENEVAVKGEESSVLDRQRTVSPANLIENALEPLEDWLAGVDTSPEVENRFIQGALALTEHAVSLLERVASGIAATHPSSAYAKRARRAALALAQRADRITNDLLLTVKCDCGDGCMACGYARGLAAVDLQADESAPSLP
jgi:hypothetical protein